MKKIAGYLVVGLIGFMLAWMLLPHGEVVTIPSEVIEIPHYIPTPSDTIYSTIHDTLIKTLPEYIYRTDTITQFDTIKIIGGYFSKVYYSDTIQDSTFIAIVNDTISQNRIISRRFSYQDLSVPIIDDSGWLIGAELYYPFNIGIVGGYQKKKLIYTVGISSNYFKAGVLYKF